MKKIALILSFFTLGFASCVQRSVKPDFLNGSWLSETLLDSLRATRSTLIAARAAKISNIDIAGGGIIGMHGFHDSFNHGIERLTEIRPGVFRVLGNPKDTIYYTKEDGQYRLSLSTFPGDAFIRIDRPVEHIINDIVIAGTYRDSKGNQFSFKTDGATDWPKAGCVYRICLDYWMIEKDCIVIRTTNDADTLYYGYSFRGDTLRFHKEISYPVNTPDAYTDFLNAPFVSLTKVK